MSAILNQDKSLLSRLLLPTTTTTTDYNDAAAASAAPWPINSQPHVHSFPGIFCEANVCFVKKTSFVIGVHAFLFIPNPYFLPYPTYKTRKRNKT